VTLENNSEQFDLSLAQIQMRTLCQVLAHKGNEGPSEQLLRLNRDLLRRHDGHDPQIISPKILVLANRYSTNPQKYWFSLKNLLKETMDLRRHIGFGKFYLFPYLKFLNNLEVCK
jgi:hypothetical protein